MPEVVTVAGRFWSKVAVGDPAECWMWQASGLPYGYFWLEGKKVTAHRVAYMLAVGPIPGGLHVDHGCRRPGCCNPAHLEAVTSRENTMRGFGPSARAARVTHCPHGHPYAGANLAIDPRGHRRCRACARRRRSERYWKGLG
jgi:hypothetical protein